MKKFKIPCLIVLAGVICMVLGNFLQKQNKTIENYTVDTKAHVNHQSSEIYDGATNATVTDWRVITEYHQNRIADFLQNVKGVGRVSVLVYCDQSSVLELVANSALDMQSVEENDGSGGTRKTENSKTENEYLVVQDSSGNQRIVAISESVPAISSVCVVCTGGDKAAVQERIIAALSTLYDLPASKIIVVQGT